MGVFMTCKNCGKEVIPTSVFCQHCGQKLDQTETDSSEKASSRGGSAVGTSKKASNSWLVILVLSLVLFGACSLLFNNSSSSSTSNSYSQSPAQYVKQWYEGGSLHSSTVAEWKTASYENKLATAADWLASSKWKGHLNTSSDFDNMKQKAEILVAAVDKAVSGNAPDSWKMNEITAAILVMSNDLDP